MENSIETTRAAIERRDWTAVNATCQELLSAGGAGEEDLLALFLEVLPGCDFQQGWELAKLFPRLGRRAIAPVIRLLETDGIEMETRWVLARVLGEFDDRGAVEALARLAARTGDEDLATMAAEALGSIGAPAIESLAALLDDPASRGPAVRALSRVRHPGAIAPLLEALDAREPVLRAMAIEALSGFPVDDERIAAAIGRSLRDPAPEPRREAVIASAYVAGRYPGENFPAAIAPLLGDADPEVRRGAAIALGRIGTAAAAGILAAGLFSESAPEDLKVAIVNALGWIENGRASDYLEAGLREQDERVCQEIVTVLARWTATETRARAARALERFHAARPSLAGRTGIKRSLAFALGELRHPDSRATLLALAADGEPSVRLHALSALKKLDRMTGT